MESNNEIDTLERYHNGSLLLVDILDYGFLGYFSMNVGYIRNFGNGSSIIYQSNIKNKFQFSESYIAETNFEKQKIEWGWYNIDNDGLNEMLPKVDKIEDSLKLIYPLDYFVTYNDKGFFFIFLKGKKIKQFNYGNLITNDSTTNFDSFEFGLYKLVNNHFILVSSNSKDLFKKGAGIFFVPKPGGDVISKFKKSMMDSIFMSFHSFDDCPNRITINPE